MNKKLVRLTDISLAYGLTRFMEQASGLKDVFMLLVIEHISITFLLFVFDRALKKNLM